jgi:hypothetical protein
MPMPDRDSLRERFKPDRVAILKMNLESYLGRDA